ncbi:MAG: tyrosine-type recombinase/integrase [Azospirillaceae bacterium]|nr:tyrosine-type recombinase/integrase [Azospirillaceae bacterium]
MVDSFTPGPAIPFVPEATEPRAPDARPRPEAGRLPACGTEVMALSDLAQQARAYAQGAKADNTNRAYAADWRHFTGWCIRNGVALLPPDPQVIGLYITALASAPRRPTSVATLERRLSGLVWNYRSRGQFLDRGDPHIKEVLAGIRRHHGQPPAQKDPVLGEDLLRMVETLGRDLRGLRDRAILLLGFAGGLRRSEIVGLDVDDDPAGDGTGRLEILAGGALLQVKGKTGWRTVEVGRGSNDQTCPVAAVELWLKLARIAHGPVFRRVSRDGKRALDPRLNDRHVARLVQNTAVAAGLRGDLPEGLRRARFAGHSLRAGLATAAEAEERHVQKHLGHASAEMTRRYQRRRERFRINLTKAAGL